MIWLSWIWLGKTALLVKTNLLRKFKRWSHNVGYLLPEKNNVIPRWNADWPGSSLNIWGIRSIILQKILVFRFIKSWVLTLKSYFFFIFTTVKSNANRVREATDQETLQSNWFEFSMTQKMWSSGLGTVARARNFIFPILSGFPSGIKKAIGLYAIVFQRGESSVRSNGNNLTNTLVEGKRSVTLNWDREIFPNWKEHQENIK